MRYVLTLRWLKFAVIALLGWLAASVPVILAIAWFNLPPLLILLNGVHGVMLLTWYIRRAKRDMAEYERRRF